MSKQVEMFMRTFVEAEPQARDKDMLETIRMITSIDGATDG